MNNNLAGRDIFVFVLLSAIWGSSFLFLRIASPVFGPIFLVEMRLLSALMVLLPFCILRGKMQEIRENWKNILLLSLCNMTLPFCLLSYAVLSINAGMASILNATVPFFTALVAFIVWSKKLSLLSVVGMMIGFVGVAALVFDPVSSNASSNNFIAIAAAVLGSLLYGTAANITSYKLNKLSGIAVTVGGLGFASIVMAPFAIIARPEEMPQGMVWLSVLTLGIVCTGFAYLLFYQLIGRIGANRAVSTTFLVPPFSILWGWVFLGEQLTLSMLIGCVLVLAGVYVTTGRFSTPSLQRK